MATIADTEREYLRGKAEALTNAKHGEKSKILTDIQAFLGIDRKTAYRRLAEVGYQSERKQREDKGNGSLTKEECVLISNLLVESTRKNGKRLLGIGDAIDILAANGRLSRKPSSSTASRLMYQHNVHPEQLNKPEPHRQVRSLYPNHVHQIDVSVCVLFYLKGKAGMRLMEEDEFNKNKPKNIERIAKNRVLRYAETDHYSGSLYVEYFLSPGENQETLFKFLMSSWGAVRNEYSLMHGVPKILVWDKGSANISYLIKNLLKHLTVQPIEHKKGKPRVKGQVENGHNIVERKFEGRLCGLEIDTLEELNQAAWEWMRDFNSVKIHRRHKHSRYGLWQTIKAEQLRLCPPKEICQQLLSSKPIEKTVKGGLTVSHAIKGYPSMDYRVHTIPDIYVGQKVEIAVNPYRAPNIDVLIGDQRYEIEPIITNEAGFDVNAPVWGESYKNIGDTPMDTMRKAMLCAAYDVNTPEEAEKAKERNKRAFKDLDMMADVKKAQLPNFMEKKGQPLEVAVPSVVIQPLSIMEVLRTVKTRLGRALTSEENQLIRSWYPNKEVPPDQIDNIIAALQGGGNNKVRAVS